MERKPIPGNDRVLVGYNVETDEYDILALAGPEAHHPPKLIRIPAWFLDEVYNRASEGGIEDRAVQSSSTK